MFERIKKIVSENIYQFESNKSVETELLTMGDEEINRYKGEIKNLKQKNEELQNLVKNDGSVQLENLL